MARRKKSSRRSRRFFGFKRRSRSRSSSSGSSFGGRQMLAAAVYGATRNELANFVSPLSSKVPLGTIGDEVTLGGGAYLAKKWVKMPFLRDVLNSVMVVEAARVGAAVRDGSAFQNAGNSSASAQTIPIF